MNRQNKVWKFLDKWWWMLLLYAGGVIVIVLAIMTVMHDNHFEKLCQSRGGIAYRLRDGNFCFAPNSIIKIE